MKNKTYQFALAAITLTAFLLSANIVKAAPVRINQVVQVVNAKPGKAKTGGFTQLRLADDDNTVNSTKDDSETPQDDRVIVTKTVEVVEDEQCDCIASDGHIKNGFPKWTLLGLAAIPVAVVLLNQKDKTPTPGPTTPTPGPTTPTPEPTTPNPTFTPTPEPVPEPMTILLFGTGLAGIGVSARRRLRRKTETTVE